MPEKGPASPEQEARKASFFRRPLKTHLDNLYKWTDKYSPLLGLACAGICFGVSDLLVKIYQAKPPELLINLCACFIGASVSIGLLKGCFWLSSKLERFL